jgi:4-amino-4-deoxy-L-arabinose transferase-like glycosyltransferase
MGPNRIRHTLLWFGLSLGFAAFYLNGLSAVPFHPDESTYIFMSRDFETVFLRRDPGALAWTAPQPLSREARYRLLDGPVLRYLIGLGGWAWGFTTADLNGDWDWEAAWRENVQAGHRPSPGLLLASRIPEAILTALAVGVLFRMGADVRGVGVGLAAALLFGLNALTQLHGRRAMAEGPALFFSVLTVWGVVHLTRLSDKAAGLDRRIVGLSALVGVSLGLAAASKHTGAALILVACPAAGLALMQRPWPLARRWTAAAGVSLTLALGSLLTAWALNPILYRAPLANTRAMLAARVEFTQRQIDTIGYLFPHLLTPTPLARLRAALLEIFLRPPAVWDVPIYAADQASQAEAYLSSPATAWSRHPLAGAVLLGLTLAGLAFSALRVARNRFGPHTRGEQIFWLWLAVTLGLILLIIPLDWQRYFFPLLPPACLFASLGLDALAQPLARYHPRRVV